MCMSTVCLDTLRLGAYSIIIMRGEGSSNDRQTNHNIIIVPTITKTTTAELGMDINNVHFRPTDKDIERTMEIHISGTRTPAPHPL